MVIFVTILLVKASSSITKNAYSAVRVILSQVESVRIIRTPVFMQPLNLL